MHGLLQDLRCGIRSLLRIPGLTLAVLLCIALGVGANSAIFSVVNGVLLTPLPYEEPQRLCWIWGTWEKNQAADPLSDADFLDLREQSGSFSAMAAFQTGGRVSLGGDGPAESVRLNRVSSGYFRVLARSAMLGRTFVAEEADSPVVVLSHGLWIRRYAGAADVLGKSILLDGVGYEVIGVMAPGFKDVADGRGQRSDLWLPLELEPEMSRGMHRLQVIARLKEGVEPAQAQDELARIASRLQDLYPDTNHGKSWWIEDLKEGIVGGTRRTLLMLFGAVGVVLLVACVNVANLLLSRASARQRETALRAALGAGRLRLLRQHFSESLILGLVGGVLGLLLALASTGFLLRISSLALPMVDSVGVDLKVLGFTLAISVIATFLFGILPAVESSREDIAEALRAGGTALTGGLRRRSPRGALVVLEVALALVMTVTSALLAKSLFHLRSVDPGFRSQGRLVMQLGLPASDYEEPDAAADFFDRLLRRVQSLPGVHAAALAEMAPFSPYLSCSGFEIEGRPPFPQEEAPCSEYRSVSPEYFQTLGIPVLSGRLPERKQTAGAPQEAVINQAMASQLFSEGSPLGERVTFGGPTFTIVGVVGDTRSAALSFGPLMQVYVPLGPGAGRRLHIVVQAESQPELLIPVLRAELLTLDANLAFDSISSMDSLLDRSVSSRHFSTSLMGLFALTALLLAATGVYGMISFFVTRRSKEIGVRMALGATAGMVRKQVVWQGMRPVVLGLTIGLLAAAGLTRLVSSLLYEISALDPWVFVVAPVCLAMAAVLACWFPARRATRVDPLRVLRYE